MYSLVQGGLPRAHCWALWHIFSVCTDGNVTKSLVNLKQWKSVSWRFEVTSHVPVGVHYLWSSHWIPLERNWFYFFIFLEIIIYNDEITQSLLFSSLNSSCSPSLSLQERLQSLHHLCGHSLMSPKWLLISFVLENPELAILFKYTS